MGPADCPVCGAFNSCCNCLEQWREINEGLHSMRRVLVGDLYCYESVQDPFVPGHIIVVRYKEGEKRPLTWEEESFNALPWYEKIWVRIQYHIGDYRMRRRWEKESNDKKYLKKTFVKKYSGAPWDDYGSVEGYWYLNVSWS